MKIKKYRLEYSEEDIQFVNKEIEKSLRAGYLTDGGPNISTFEKEWCDFNNSKHSIAVSNCTTGLECILRAIDVKDKSVVVPAYTFIASIMSIYTARGTPILADIDRSTLSLSLESVKRAVREDTKAVMIVHVGGVVSNEIVKIRDYCDENNIFLIEDAACAHGSTYSGVNSGNFGHAACFSFHHSKVLTSGEGGIITTECDEIAQKVKRIRAIGLDRSINNWQSFDIGSNAKMSEITATLAILHTRKAPEIIKERQNIAEKYNTLIDFNHNFSAFLLPDNTNSSYYKYFVKTGNSFSILDFSNFMLDNGIELPPVTYSYTCDQQKVCEEMKCVYSDDFANAKYMTSHHVCLPMYNGLREEEILYVVKTINKYLNNKNAS